MAKNIRNQISQATRNTWLANFSAENNNPYDPFSRSRIMITRTIFETITSGFNCHIKIYFGLDSDENPKVIAVPCYELDPLDIANMEKAWDDILKPGRIYELCEGEEISVEDAKIYISNFAQNSNHEFYAKSFILPRPNFFEIFYTLDSEYALIDLGLKKEITVMIYPVDENGNPPQDPIYINNSMPCPPFCNKFGLNDE